jgi:hypothetical protein
MLKITVQEEIDEIRVKLEGDLAGTWVGDLEECWRASRSASGGKASCLDLTGVTRVDDAGRYLLALIHGTGARMVSAGVEMKALLESIDQDWPATRNPGTGWAASPAPRTPRP